MNSFTVLSTTELFNRKAVTGPENHDKHNKMSTIKEDTLPVQALLRRYRSESEEPGEPTYTDCFSAEITGDVTLAEFVLAFYTTPLFKLERVILKYLARKPSSDEDAMRLADGRKDDFAAWTVEDRNRDQLLMCDFRGRTRSWFMVVPESSTDKPATRLYFGSAVVPAPDRTSGKPEIGSVYRMLLGFHRLYSIALLKAARNRLVQAHA